MKAPASYVVGMIIVGLLMLLVGRLLHQITHLYSQPGSSDQATMIFCAVGQGDAILLVHQDWQALIDTGQQPDALLSCLRRHMPRGDTTIELLVLTHADADHIGAAGNLFNEYTVASVMIDWFERETADFTTLESIFQIKSAESELQIVPPLPGITLQVSQQVRGVVLHPDGLPRGDQQPQWIGKTTRFNSDSELQLWDVTKSSWTSDLHQIDHNERSTTLFFEIFGHTVLLHGDLGALSEQALIQQGLITHTDIVKAGHHGSKYSTSTELLDATQPEYIVVSAGQNNTYGHPAPEVIERAALAGAQVLTTQYGDDVIFTFLPDQLLVDGAVVAPVE